MAHTIVLIKNEMFFGHFQLTMRAGTSIPCLRGHLKIILVMAKIIYLSL